MASTEEIIQRLRDSKPPATDAATYLTILDMSLTPEILPALHEMLQDVALTSEIGWDLVEMLAGVAGSEACLETVARLGNPREVILKVLEAMDRLHQDDEEGMDFAEEDEDEEEEEEEEAGGMEGAGAGAEEGGGERTGGNRGGGGGGGGTTATREDDKSRLFVTLCGMLGILHKRLRVKAPSRFLHTTLDTVLRAYAHTSHQPASTAALVTLVQALAGGTRPPLPARRASSALSAAGEGLATPQQQLFQDAAGGAGRAPDPEADDQQDPLRNGQQGQRQDEQQQHQQSESETRAVVRLLQAFIACAVEEYVRRAGLEWAARLLEFEYPGRVVAGRGSVMRMFKERDELHEKDALVGQLVSLASDLGLASLPPFRVRELLEAPICRNPLAEEDPDKIQPSTGGLLCLHAYWMFAAEVFDADRGLPERQLFPRYMLPEHHALLQHYLGDDPQGQIARNPGTVEALIVMAIALDAKQRHVDDENDEEKGAAGRKGGTAAAAAAAAAFMPYHHLLTLVSVFHPNLRVRNAATVVAGNLLHADPDEDSRLAIMEDLLENCMFSGLQACAVTWLREEIILANTRKKSAVAFGDSPGTTTTSSSSRFGSPDCLETIQYALFPDLTRLHGADAAAVLDFWSSSGPLHLQVANFALFLFTGEDYRGLAPAGMAAAIEHRYVEPLVHAAGTLRKAIADGEVPRDGELLMQLSILTDTLGRVPLQ